MVAMGVASEAWLHPSRQNARESRLCVPVAGGWELYSNVRVNI